MKKLLLGCALALGACSAEKGLYSWADYQNASYQYLRDNDEEASQELIRNYEKIIKKQKGKRKVVPPGVYADYGFVLLQLNRMPEAKVMFQNEMALYPESKIFLERVLKMIEP